MDVRELLAQLREDWEAHGRPLASPGFHTVAFHRFGRYASRRPPLLRYPLLALYAVISTLLRNLYGIEVPLDVEIGRRVVFAHQGGTVVARHAVIGDDSIIRQNVTIGADAQGSNRSDPVLGRRVEVGAGAVLIGGITVGDGARIGPNAVVMKDVPTGALAFTAPARVMPPLEAADQAT